MLKNVFVVSIIPREYMRYKVYVPFFWERGRGMEKKKIETFEDLRVWQKGIEWVLQIYFFLDSL